MMSLKNKIQERCPFGCEEYEEIDVWEHGEQKHPENLFKCNIEQCGRLFLKATNLLYHIETKDSHCGFRDDRGDLFDKEERDSEFRYYLKVDCLEQLSLANLIICPVDLKEFGCRSCSSKKSKFRTYRYKSALNHVDTNHPSLADPKTLIKYKCRVCVHDFPIKQDLENHIDFKHSTENCSFCPQKVPKESDHLALHYDCLFKCAKCGFGFEEYSQVKEHLKDVHKVGEEDNYTAFIKLPKNWRLLRLFECGKKDCGKKFIRKDMAWYGEHLNEKHRNYLSQKLFSFCRICGLDIKDLEKHFLSRHPSHLFAKDVNSEDEDEETYLDPRKLDKSSDAEKKNVHKLKRKGDFEEADGDRFHEKRPHLENETRLDNLDSNIQHDDLNKILNIKLTEKTDELDDVLIKEAELKNKLICYKKELDERKLEGKNLQSLNQHLLEDLKNTKFSCNKKEEEIQAGKTWEAHLTNKHREEIQCLKGEIKTLKQNRDVENYLGVSFDSQISSQFEDKNCKGNAEQVTSLKETNEQTAETGKVVELCGEKSILFDADLKHELDLKDESIYKECVQSLLDMIKKGDVATSSNLLHPLWELFLKKKESMLCSDSVEMKEIIEVDNTKQSNHQLCHSLMIDNVSDQMLEKQLLKDKEHLDQLETENSQFKEEIKILKQDKLKDSDEIKSLKNSVHQLESSSIKNFCSDLIKEIIDKASIEKEETHEQMLSEDLKAQTSNKAIPSSCLICYEDDNPMLGELVPKYSCHLLCLRFASGINKDVFPNEEDFIKELNRVKKTKCKYCSKPRASLGCAEPKCRAQYHLGCAKKEDTISIHDTFVSYCDKHRTLQTDDDEKLKFKGEKPCKICGENTSLEEALTSPCCKEVNHRKCIQGEASMGQQYCLNCGDSNEEFLNDMLWYGIYFKGFKNEKDFMKKGQASPSSSIIKLLEEKTASSIKARITKRHKRKKY